MSCIEINGMKWFCMTIRALACIVLVVAMAMTSMARPCECDDETVAERSDCDCSLSALLCDVGQAPDSHSGCSCSTCPASAVKAATVSRQAGKPHRASRETTPAFVAGALGPLSVFKERQPRYLPLPATDFGILRSTILLI